MQTTDYKCKNCGANMVVTGDTAHCEYCGTTVKLDTRTEEQKEYEANRGRLRAQSEYEEIREKREDKRRRKAQRRVRFGCLHTFLLIAMCFGGFIALCFGIFYAVPGVNAFDYLTVKYSGINGSGKAEVVLQKNGEYDLTDFEYTLSKSSKLSNGDTIKVTVSPSILDGGSDGLRRTKEESKVFVVQGLQTVLSDAASLTKENLNQLASISNTAFNKDTSSDSYKNRTRYGVYCRSNELHNEVCDLYKVTYQGETVYSAILMKNLYFKNDGTPIYDESHLARHWLFYTAKNKQYISINGYRTVDDFLQDWKNTDSEFTFTENISQN